MKFIQSLVSCGKHGNNRRQSLIPELPLTPAHIKLRGRFAFLEAA
jgi:hypothetical protein